jgi:hypothetical protein
MRLQGLVYAKAFRPLMRGRGRRQRDIPPQAFRGSSDCSSRNELEKLTPT